MPQSPPGYRLIDEVKIRRESFGGILYKYGCADRGALSFINSRQLIELLLTAQQTYGGDLDAAVEHSNFSTTSKQKLYAALDDLARRGYVLTRSSNVILSAAKNLKTSPGGRLPGTDSSLRSE